MFAPVDVVIAPVALAYLRARRLEAQYLKAKRYILAGNFASASLKLRQPKKDGVWYFRINRQFRALCSLEENILYVLTIDNHQ